MCGIIGYVGPRDGVPVVFEALSQLEYRGYDSAGVAVVAGSRLRVHKRAGRVADVVSSASPRLRGAPAIGHTRWATHGGPTDANAHPHTDSASRLAVVHNGIIENAQELRETLLAEVTFRSETDTEVLAHLIAAQEEGIGLAEAVRRALLLIEGAYGLAVIDVRFPDRIVVARNGSPVLLGVGDGEHFVASDASAIVRHTEKVVYLDDREMAELTADGFRTFMLDSTSTHKETFSAPISATAYDRTGHPDYMHKEIFEQPQALERALKGRIDRRFASTHLGGLEITPRELRQVSNIKLVGCGSAYYSATVGAQLIEQLTRIPATAEPASEFRYRNPVIESDTLFIAVSQSGETFDTLGAVEEVSRKGARVIGIVNTPGSSIARACGSGIYLHAGPEVSVTSTKTFTSTSLVFALLALYLGRLRDLSPAEGNRLLDALERLPEQVGQILLAEEEMGVVGAKLSGYSDAFYVGRVSGYHVACEGAQKLKEVSYLHAEAYPASELKHGPLALISPQVPSVVVMPDDDLWDKNAGTVAEIQARGGPVIVVTDSDREALADTSTIRVPHTERELAPILLSVPLQMMAYSAALALGRDIDHPRNLAKSVTVE